MAFIKSRKCRGVKREKWGSDDQSGKIGKVNFGIGSGEGTESKFRNTNLWVENVNFGIWKTGQKWKSFRSRLRNSGIRLRKNKSPKKSCRKRTENWRFRKRNLWPNKWGRKS